jgi:hypothetical protein
LPRVIDALPALRVALPTFEPEFEKVTVPVGVGVAGRFAGETLAVRVTGEPAAAV